MKIWYLENYPGVTEDKYDIYIDEQINYQNIVFGNVEESGNRIYSLSSRTLFTKREKNFGM